MSIFFVYNGEFYKEATPVITPDNRGLKYGDGLFETIKMENGKLQLSPYHFERLFKGMQIMAFHIPAGLTANFLEKKIIALAKKNGHHNIARIRLMVLRGNKLSASENNLPNYIIQTFALPGNNTLNTNGFIIDIYDNVKKSCDMLSNLKNNNFLPYILAAEHAKKNKLNDCILLNSYGKIADTSIANIFIIKDKIVYTPPLKDGCVAGVMRRLLLEKIKMHKNAIIEKSLTIEDLKQADEIFLTNSIHPLRWVGQFQNTTYGNIQAHQIYAELIKILQDND